MLVMNVLGISIGRSYGRVKAVAVSFDRGEVICRIRLEGNWSIRGNRSRGVVVTLAWEHEAFPERMTRGMARLRAVRLLVICRVAIMPVVQAEVVQCLWHALMSRTVTTVERVRMFCARVAGAS